MTSLLSKTDTKKSSGPDGISGLGSSKLCIVALLPLLVFNLSLTSDCVPKEWKSTHITPVPKVSGTLPSLGLFLCCQ